ncbi:MAG: fluoride efflux transporter CrcB [Sphingomonas sp.]|uniref:fluoride efflux transporter CrcB n=1 Tax=Sphingomonas sp. TaxID=28214 RepID=UPI00181D7D99|nr:fluoride efflux transporter CrcB [Sphingomonas sp.]MBA3668236.1 fluoride efflux transporter CrcB [Sphingomonas sp.]
MNAALVFLGGGLGAVLRWLVGRASLLLWGATFPWGTLIVNVVGSFAIGLFVGLFAAFENGQPMRLLLVTGLLGGFTTFSAFSLDALTLWQRGQPALAAAYVLGSVVVSLAAIAAGLALTR